MTANAQPTKTSLLKQVPIALLMVWKAHRLSASVLLLLTLLQAFLPAAMAWIAKRIVDAVALAPAGMNPTQRETLFQLVLAELTLAIAAVFLGRFSLFCRELLRANLSNAINEELLLKSLSLELKHFENAATYDMMQNARREASARPLSLALAIVTVVKNMLTLSSFAVLLWSVSWWSVLVLLVAAIPSFVAETRLSGAGFRLSSQRAPESRKLNYLEWILTRDSHVKEVKLFGLGDLVLGRYRTLFDKFYTEDKKLARTRLLLGVALASLSLAAFYACYLSVASKAADGRMTVGDLTLYVALFRQGQSTFESVLLSFAGMYEDALFLSNLSAFLAIESTGERPRSLPARTPRPNAACIVFDRVSFRYPDKEDWVLRDVTLSISQGEKLALVGENGAGKSTLIKLLLRLYEPSEGAIYWDGVDLRDMNVDDLRQRVGAVFQDFVRYQFSAGENIGLGSPDQIANEKRIGEAAEAGGASPVIAHLPQRFETMLGGWFEKGVELSGGQWQKLAVSRAFMRDAELLILDEPTAAIDAEAEVAMFERFRELSRERTAIIISHRFSTVRMADRIAVLEGGRVTELGSHEQLLQNDKKYARLFRLQARGYQ
jgi:ATP-binding cassette, subfamily B, bacterial